MEKRAQILVRGRVQGVSFRAYTQQKARALGLRGYVRNLPDGGVEIVAEGKAETLAQLVEWAHRGPSMAAVEEVHVEYSAPTGTSSDFRIEY